MVRPSRRAFLGSSALTLATLTGVLSPTTDTAHPNGVVDLDVEVPPQYADAFMPIPAADALSTTYATVIAERIDADETDDLSYRGRSAANRFEVDAEDLAATVSVRPADRGVRLLTAAGDFDKIERGKTLAVGAEDDSTDGDLNDGDATEAETSDKLPSNWRLAGLEEMAVVTADGVAAAAIGGGYPPRPRSQSSGSEDDANERRIETARAAGQAAAGETNRFAESSLGSAALPKLGGFKAVLLVPDSADGSFLPEVPDDVDAFAVGLGVAPEALRDLDGQAENAYVIRPSEDVDRLTDETVDRLVRNVDPAVPVELEITRTDGLVLVDVTVEAPPEMDREASPDAKVRSRFDRAAGTVTFEHVDGESVPAAELEVWHDGEEVSETLLSGDAFEAGDEITVETGQIGTVTLRWFDPEANVYDTYGRERVDREAFSVDYEMSTETLELTYEGEQSADVSVLRLVHHGEDGTQTVGEYFTDGTVAPGDSVTVDDVSIGDSVQLEFDVEQPHGVGGGSLVHYRARPPRVWIHSRAEEGTIVRYDGEESRPADAFVTLIDGEPTDVQFADEHDTLSGDEELELGELPLGSILAVEWQEPEEPVVIAEEEVVPSTHASIEYDQETGEITVQHQGGRKLPASELELQAGRSPTEIQPDDKLDEFGPDDSFTAPVPPLSRVRLVWTGGEREHYLGGTTTARDAVTATYDPDGEEMTVEYVGEQSVNPERLRISVSGRRGRGSSDRDQESAFAAEYDELTSGDTITVENVAHDDTVIVSVHTEFENGSATSSIAHFSATPRHGFVVDDGDNEDQESSETTLRYVDEVRRDADEFSVSVDGDPATEQPADGTEQLEEGATVSLGELAAGTKIVVEWSAGDETRTVLEHVIPPQAEFEVAYDSADDSDGGTVTFTHDGGDTLTAEHVDVVVEPAPGDLRPWKTDTEKVTPGDETTVTVEVEPRLAVVVFRDREVLHRVRLNQDE